MATALSVESCIEMFRAALAKLGIPERDVEVTWDAQAGWARFRCKLPSGAIVDRREVSTGKIPRDALASDVALTALARWLKAIAKTKPADLDAAFAEHIVGKPDAPPCRLCDGTGPTTCVCQGTGDDRRGR